MTRHEFVTHTINGELVHLTISEDWKFGREGYKRLKSSARQRSIPFQIKTPEELVTFWLSQPDKCYWCELTDKEFQEFHQQVLHNNTNTYLVNKLKKLLINYNSKYLTFDRIDSNKGYHVENMVKSCPICNFTKGSFLTLEEFKPIARNNINRLMSAVTESEEND